MSHHCDADTLASVCKHICDERGAAYKDDWDLARLGWKGTRPRRVACCTDQGQPRAGLVLGPYQPQAHRRVCHEGLRSSRFECGEGFVQAACSSAAFSAWSSRRTSRRRTRARTGCASRIAPLTSRSTRAVSRQPPFPSGSTR